MSDRRLSPREAAAYVESEWHLKVSPSTVRRWATKGAVPAQRTAAGRILIDPADLHAIFDATTATDGND
jgi:hypothetical protein